MQDEILNTIKEDLKLKHVYVSDEWLSTVRRSFPTSNLNSNHIYRKWLFADISASCAQDGLFIPSGFTIPDCVGINTIGGTYPVQLIRVSNASAPPVNDENEFMRLDEPEEFGEANVENETKNKQSVGMSIKKKTKGPRLLSLEITDGKNCFKAIEYKPIPAIDEKLNVGTKILLKGPIQIQFGILFLRPDNVEVLGGKVENRVNQVRSSRLSLQENSIDVIDLNDSDLTDVF